MGGPKVPRPFPTEKKKDFIFLGPLAAGNAISSAPGASTQPSHFSPAVRATGTGTEEKGQVSTCCLQDFFYVARKIVNNGVVKIKFLDFFSRVLPFFIGVEKSWQADCVGSCWCSFPGSVATARPDLSASLHLRRGGGRQASARLGCEPPARVRGCQSFNQ